MTGLADIRHLIGKLDGPIAARPLEKIFQTIRMEIACGYLRPRERLIEHEQCMRFGTSNHNIRQVFELLDRIGLIDRRPNRGVEVKSLSRDELNDLNEVCVLLQDAGARRIDLSKTLELADRLDKINLKYLAAIQEGSLPKAVAANDAFHIATFESCMNIDLATLQLTYWLKASAVISHDFFDEQASSRMLKDHAEIIAAIRARDLVQFSTIAVNHIRTAIEAYKRDCFLSDPDMPNE